ncbi:hypothetical protein [Methanobacterium ferruginis]|uniref:hypothetical protein n=1 Tax=Methanobacterium ferruginis TaxID=710191 RepID=UPI0025741D02|nr:hypothetical protein [Methanobacterium ferruginis]BDZ68910.1 hypothetical protein GCM10025860_23580 [Methanobacterium ferruginis]
MILFLDSNVTIGYVFNLDRWNTNAKHVMQCPNSKYYSENVLNETKKKIRIIDKKIFSGLLFISAEILRDRSIPDNLTLDDTIHFLYKNKLRILENYINKLFSENYWFDVSKEELSIKITEAANIFKQEYITNFQFLKSTLKKHTRTKNYDILTQKLLKKVHMEDVLIVLDAHDLCHYKNPMTLITSDSIEDRNQYIVKNTHIDAIKDLRDFYMQ